MSTPTTYAPSIAAPTPSAPFRWRNHRRNQTKKKTQNLDGLECFCFVLFCFFKERKRERESDGERTAPQPKSTTVVSLSPSKQLSMVCRIQAAMWGRVVYCSSSTLGSSNGRQSSSKDCKSFNLIARTGHLAAPAFPVSLCLLGGKVKSLETGERDEKQRERKEEVRGRERRENWKARAKC